MLDDLIRVDPDAVRAGAVQLDSTGDQLSHGFSTLALPPASPPGWNTHAALADLAAAVRAHLGEVGGQATDAASRLRAAAGEYEAADERAARRTAALR
ncbi:type VII secretion target [Micromonospora sp. NPDC049679]|uniref:type VII secretion target n=1 Tax=Micromonospora sp. NPDC049679 TaxID=3155920 RepID=UPI0033FC59EB